MKMVKVIKKIIKYIFYRIKNKISYKIFGKKYLVYRKVCKASKLLS